MERNQQDIMILATQMMTKSEKNVQPPKHNVTTDSLGKMVRKLTNLAKEL
jgi:hypothetical protein